MNLKRAVRIGLVTSLIVASLSWAAAPASAATLRCNGKIVTITGTNGSDVINGTQGNDVIHGLRGNDVIHGLGGNDSICGASGMDTIYGDSGRDFLGGGPQSDKLYGGDGPDRMIGYTGNDLLQGGKHADVMIGGDGKDLIDGGANGGEARGNAGRDACYNATEGRGSGCEEDQLWLSRTSGVERSDMLEIQDDERDSDVNAVRNVPINGHVFRRAIGCLWIHRDDWCEIEYNLGRHYQRFAAYVGTGDRSESTAGSAVFEVIGDGNVISSTIVRFGEHRRVVANVTNVLRLKIRITGLDNGTHYDSTNQWWTEPRVSARPGLYPAGAIN